MGRGLAYAIHLPARVSSFVHPLPTTTRFISVPGLNRTEEREVGDAPTTPTATSGHQLIKVCSGKKLKMEVKEIASTLVPDKDWPLCIGAMERIECLLLEILDEEII
ncbi:hypothetical protein Vadar_004113 [Vaccinium darrowii]|uniref:Uncharacterized protein n=1 Tax=Vaccinium darrowii TaxID=229202 RepID=A0ACB7XFD6_9ERIC|nr:hypothetical protein Vadar_004113 [Vaccinium darrowii]